MSEPPSKNISQREYERSVEPCQGFEIRLSDRSLGVFYNNGIEIIFHSSNDEFPVIRREFQLLMVQQTGSRTARFTVTDVFYRFVISSAPWSSYLGVKELPSSS